jgi:flagellar hook assembly protein FlgD
VLSDDVQPAGRHTAGWDGRDANGRRVPAGTYFARLEFAGEQAAQEMTLAL